VIVFYTTPVDATTASRITSVVPTPAGTNIDSDDPACFRVSDTLTHERKISLTLADQRSTALNYRPVPDFEVHRIP
jgi:hypothetical protein